MPRGAETVEPETWNLPIALKKKKSFLNLFLIRR